MIPTPDLIREILELLSSDAAWDMGRLSELAEAYAQACDKAMERVYKCRYLLQEKLRREARQVVEEEPRLLEELELLDIDSNSAWSSLCQELELPFPSEFDPDELSTYRDLVSWKVRLHQGLGRKGFARKIDRLLGEFDFGPIGKLLAPLLAELE